MSRSALVKGTIVLTVASLISKFLGSIFRIPLQNIAGDEVLGILTLVYPIYMVALILSVAGIPVAISKLIARERVHQNQANIQAIHQTAKILTLFFGLFSFVLIFVLSHPIAYLLGGSSVRLSLIVVSATLLIAPYMAVYRGYFQGFGSMKPTAISQVIEQFLRVGLILAIAYIFTIQGYSKDVVAGYMMIGSVAGAFASLSYLQGKYRKQKSVRVSRYNFSTFRIWSRKILKLSLPIAIGSITMALLNFVDSLTIPQSLKAFGIQTEEEVYYIYGIYGRGLTLVQIATVFAASAVLPLIPALTEKIEQRDVQGAKDIIKQTFDSTQLISWPAAVGLFALTMPLNIALFSNGEGSSVLALLHFSSIFISLTILGTGILQGLNLANLAALFIVGGVVAKAVLNILFIPHLGLYGAALSTFFVYLLLFSLNTIFIRKNIPFPFFTKKVWKVIISSLIMGTMVGAPTLFLTFAEWGRFFSLLYVMLAALIGAAIYFFLLYRWKVLDKKRFSTWLSKMK